MNRLVLAAKLIEKSALRYTPAGVPALDLQLMHESTVSEDGQPRKVSMEIRAIGIGGITSRLQSVALGVPVEMAGFLAATRNGKGIVFHVTEVA